MISSNEQWQHADTAFQRMLLNEIKSGLKEKLRDEVDKILDPIIDEALRGLKTEIIKHACPMLGESLVEVHLFKNKEPLK